MPSHTEEPGLRERKRLATRRAIQLAVITLAGERGIDKVTIEDISRMADISPRTFFNYFPSKDAALVGDTPHLASEDDIARFVSGGSEGNMLEQLAELLSASLKRTEADRELHQKRREVMKDNTYLFGLRMNSLRDFEDSLQAIIERRFLADDPGLADKPDVLRERALLFTLVAVAAMRHAWRCWADGTVDGTVDGSLADRVASSFTELYEMTLRTK